MLRRFFAIGLLLCLGCAPGPGAPPEPDGGSAPPPGDTDLDGDGLCDELEPGRGVDPTRADTDGDGYPDGVELLGGLDPSDAMSPSAFEIVTLAESAGAAATYPLSARVDGRGDSFAGAFESSASWDARDEQASTFFVAGGAVAATPSAGASRVDVGAQRFEGVFGRVELGFEVRFGFMSVVPRGCRRAHPFRYVVKRSDGAIVTANYAMLVVDPAVGTRAWCALPGPCR